MNASVQKRTTIILLFLFTWCLVLVGFIYSNALILPFFFDDLIILPYLSESSFAQLLTTPAIFPYYRPVLPIIWKFSYLVLGEYNAILLHGINLFLHAINAFLSAYFANLLLRAQNHPWQTRTLGMFLVATIYLLFPFHFQAVPWVTAVYHILVTTFILITLIAYWQHRHSGQKRWLVLGVTTTFLALFTQENGILILPLLLFLELSFSSSRTNKQRWINFLIWTLPALIWFPIWISRPKTTSELRLNQLETIFQNSVWVIQGIAFPFTWAGGKIRDAGCNDLLTTIALALIALATIGLINRIRANKFPRPQSLFTLLTYPFIFVLLTSLPILFLLPFSYLLSSPRLLTLPAVGIAWIWGFSLTILITKIYKTWQHSWLQTGFTLLLCLILLGFTFIPAFIFLKQQMGYYKMLGSAFNQLVSLTTDANSKGNRVVALNFPYELGPQNTFYPLGHEGVVFTVNYIPTANIVAVQTETAVQLTFIRVDDIRSQTPYIHAVLGSDNTYESTLSNYPTIEILNSTYTSDTIQLQNVGQSAPSEKRMPQATFILDEVPMITLEDSGFSQKGREVSVTSTWQISAPVPNEITLFVHVLDKTGQLIAQDDGFVWAGSYPMSRWSPTTTIQDRRTIQLNNAEVQYPLTIYIGLYNGLTGERVAAFDRFGNIQANNAVEISPSGFPSPNP